MNDVKEITRHHNMPPVECPSVVEVLDDVRARYPEVEPRAAELLASAAAVPARIADDETAKGVQTLLRSMTETMGSWKANRTEEKGPWQKVSDATYAFFTNPMEKVKKSHDDIKARYTAYREDVAEKERLAREERAKAERAEAARLARQADEARAARETAEREEREAKAREAEALRKAEEAEQRRLDAEAAAAKAKAEEARVARAKKEREDAERKELQSNMSDLRGHARLLERLLVAEADGRLAMTDVAVLKDLLSPHGAMAQAAAPILRSIDLLDETAAEGFAAIRERRKQVIADREKHAADQMAEARRKEREQADRLEAEAQAKRRQEREAEEAKLADARKAREDEERKAAEAKAEQKAAKSDAREARTDARDAYADAKAAGKTEKEAGVIAEKTENRADRMQRAAEGATDADLTRLRGEHGTVGSLSGRWVVADIDHSKVPLEALRGFFLDDHVAAAVYRFMRASQGEWSGREIVADKLPGVIFERIPETRITG